MATALKMLLLGRFVYGVYPLDDFSPEKDQDIKKCVFLILVKQLLILVQEAIAKALRRKLRKLSEHNQENGPLELQLVDLLFSHNDNGHLEPEALLEDLHICLDVFGMVSSVLLQCWTPTVKFRYIFSDIREIISRLQLQLTR